MEPKLACNEWNAFNQMRTPFKYVTFLISRERKTNLCKMLTGLAGNGEYQRCGGLTELYFVLVLFGTANWPDYFELNLNFDYQNIYLRSEVMV